jgi:hypothetical protein
MLNVETMRRACSWDLFSPSGALSQVAVVATYLCMNRERESSVLAYACFYLYHDEKESIQSQRFLRSHRSTPMLLLGLVECLLRIYEICSYALRSDATIRTRFTRSVVVVSFSRSDIACSVNV